MSFSSARGQSHHESRSPIVSNHFCPQAYSSRPLRSTVQKTRLRQSCFLPTCQNYISVKPKLHGSYKYEHCCVNKFAEWISSIEFRLRRMFSVGVQSSGLLPINLPSHRGGQAYRKNCMYASCWA